MSTENQREAAQLEQRDTPRKREHAALAVLTAFLGELVGEPSQHGFQVRGLHIAPPDAQAQQIERLRARVAHLERQNSGMRRSLRRYRKQITGLMRAIEKDGRFINLVSTYYPDIYTATMARLRRKR